MFGVFEGEVKALLNNQVINCYAYCSFDGICIQLTCRKNADRKIATYICMWSNIAD